MSLPASGLAEHTRCTRVPNGLAKEAAFELATFSKAADSSITVEVATPHNAGLSGAGPSAGRKDGRVTASA